MAALVEVKRRTSFSSLAEHISQDNLLASLAELSERDKEVSSSTSRNQLDTIPEVPPTVPPKEEPQEELPVIPPPDFFGYASLVALVIITIFGIPGVMLSPTAYVTVTYYAWVTAVSTGLGVLPFYFISNPNPYYMGLSNGILHIIHSCII